MLPKPTALPLSKKYGNNGAQGSLLPTGASEVKPQLQRMSVTLAAAAFRFTATSHAVSPSWSAGALTLCQKAIIPYGTAGTPEGRRPQGHNRTIDGASSLCPASCARAPEAGLGDPLGQACRYTSCERCIHAQLNMDVLAIDMELTGMISSAASGITAAYEHVLFNNDMRNGAEIKFCKVRFLY